jgi:hypothetical protein
MKKIIARIKGGLGNQLFCYAAARRLALVNNAELVIDDVTGFARDREYRRRYMLDRFQIPVRKATQAERLEPFERYRRGLIKWLSRRKPFSERPYLEQEGLDFDERLLGLRVKDSLYLDGLWQSEGYFKDVEETIREDLRIIPPTDESNQRMAEQIRNSNAVALHVRCFDPTGYASSHNLSTDYYERAITLMDAKLSSPQYFLFSDAPESTGLKLHSLEGRMILVAHNHGAQHAYADLWLMTQCRHLIIANSTFSWWGAWLGGGEDKIVLTPNVKIDGKTAWGFKGLIPNDWGQV